MTRELMSVTAFSSCWNARRCCCHTSRIDKQGSYCIRMTWFELHCALVDFHQDLDLRELLSTTLTVNRTGGDMNKVTRLFFFVFTICVILFLLLFMFWGVGKGPILSTENKKKKKTHSWQHSPTNRLQYANASLNVEDVQHHKIQQRLRKQKPQWRLWSQTSNTEK